MLGLEIDVSELKTNSVEINIPNMEFKLNFIYNKKDDNIYMAIKDLDENFLLGHTRLVRMVDYFELSPFTNSLGYQLYCLRINQYAGAADKVTIENFSKDYKLFLIEKGA